jgi:uncharacterized protein
MHDINRIFTHSYSALIISDNFDTFSIPGTDLPTVHKNEPLLNQIAGDKPMSKNEKTDTRRAFLKTLGIAGVGSLLIPLNSCTETSDNVDLKKIQPFTVPTRPYGKTGENVSILSLGGVVEKSNQVLYRYALRRGITYWDTADSYGRGNNELGIGLYFSKFPQDRKKVFLVTKAGTSDPKELTERLDRSLQKMNTSYIDMFFIHYVSDAKKELTSEVKIWAEKAKTQGKIRYFGFSAHKNMESSMLVAAKLGWIDGIMVSYNYRLMVKDEMKEAVDACVEAGIGITAMKTQASFFSGLLFASVGSESDTADRLTERFLKKGYTMEQAKLKAVWENTNIASVCSSMPNLTTLEANIAAATNQTKLTQNDLRLFDQYALETNCEYCMGCADICESAIDYKVPISDILRYSMYRNSYKDRDKAVRLFESLPADVKADIILTDYSKAEKDCPQNIAISYYLKKTYQDLV